MNNIKITKEMNIRTARNIYNELIFVKGLLIKAYSNEFVTNEVIFENMRYTIQCSVHEIMSCLEIDDEEYFGELYDCVADNDSFEYVLQMFDLSHIDYSDEIIDNQINQMMSM